jgi:putative DNA primase/helicase
MTTNTDLQPIPEILENPRDQDFATDLGASIRFVEEAKPTLRYCPGVGWLAWDEQRWAPDGESEAIELAKRTARKWVLERLEHLEANPGDSELKKKLSMALFLEGAQRIRAVVDLAKTDPCLRIDAGDLDRDQWLLNVQNGTLDLRTGHLLPHRVDDYITKLAPVEYVPEATHPMLEKYLEHISASSPEMVSFLARCFGATLTGDASVESLFVLQGEGASGKTTLVEAIALMMGDYVAKLRFESFCLHKHGRSPGGASPDLITLRGARLAYASEGDQSSKLDAGIVKELTGKEALTARALYKEPVTFNQTWKLWLVSNFDPKAESDDTGIWRRVLKLHFKVVPKDKRDPRLKESLANDPAGRSALLSWCLNGCLDWQRRGGGREGLAAPECVVAVTNEYREKQDLLGEWWKALLVDAQLKENEVTAGRLLRQHYLDWAAEQGATPVQAKRFRDYLIGRGLQSYRDARIRGWRGVKLDYIETQHYQKTLTLQSESSTSLACVAPAASQFAKSP